MLYPFLGCPLWICMVFLNCWCAACWGCLLVSVCCTRGLTFICCFYWEICSGLLNEDLYDLWMVSCDGRPLLLLWLCLLLSGLLPGWLLYLFLLCDLVLDHPLWHWGCCPSLGVTYLVFYTGQWNDLSCHGCKSLFCIWGSCLCYGYDSHFSHFSWV